MRSRTDESMATVQSAIGAHAGRKHGSCRDVHIVRPLHHVLHKLLEPRPVVTIESWAHLRTQMTMNRSAADV